MRKGRRVVSLRSDVVGSDLLRLGKSQEWLGEQIGVKRQYVSALFCHRRNPGPVMRDRLHRVMCKIAGRGWGEIFVEVYRDKK
jgi:hypothetical protein